MTKFSLLASLLQAGLFGTPNVLTQLTISNGEEEKSFCHFYIL